MKYFIAILLMFITNSVLADAGNYSVSAGAVQFMNWDKSDSQTGVIIEAKRTSKSGMVWFGPSFMGSGRYAEKVKNIRTTRNMTPYKVEVESRRTDGWCAGHREDEHCRSTTVETRYRTNTETTKNTSTGHRDFWIAGPWLGLNFPIIDRARLSGGVGWQHIKVDRNGSDWGPGVRFGVEMDVIKKITAGISYFRIMNDITDVDAAALTVGWAF